MIFNQLLPLVCTLLMLGCNKNDNNNGQDTTTPATKKISIDVLAAELQYPWGLAYLPNGDLLFTERPGRINLLKKSAGDPVTIATRQVQQNGEGGLLGIAVDPDFNSNHFIYLYETSASNRVVRCRLENDKVTEDKILVDGIAKATYHDGGALQFGPDGFLYIGTGDASVPSSAQDRNSPSGKILRVTRDGDPAPGNPFNTNVWSYGHRNVQGITWTASGAMFATEHGPSGEFGWCCHDELNHISPGKNYGWPVVIGDTESDTLKAPVAQSGNETWAPSGCVATGEGDIWPGHVVMACLRGSKLVRFRIDETGTGISSASDTLSGTFGRIRNIIRGPGGSLVFCTSNGNDQICRIVEK